MRISDWSSDVCSSDLVVAVGADAVGDHPLAALRLDEGLDHALGGGHIADPTVRHDGHGPSRSRLLRCRPRQEAPPAGLGRYVAGTRVPTEWPGNPPGCDPPGPRRRPPPAGPTAQPRHARPTPPPPPPPPRTHSQPDA